MRRIIFLYTLFLLASFTPPESSVHRLHYRIINDGKVIGEIHASRSVHGDQVIYDVETKMDVKVLISQRIAYTSRAVYENGILQSSSSKSYLNDKLHQFCITTLKGNRYAIKIDKYERSLARYVNYSGVLLYFKEPLNVSLVYSEMSGQDNKIRKATYGQYILTNTKSKKENRYWYKGGILERAMINHTLIDLEIQRVN